MSFKFGGAEIMIMYVCICRAVKATTVQAAVDAGAGTIEAVERACGAGGDCGACRRDIRAIIRAACAAERRRPEAA